MGVHWGLTKDTGCRGDIETFRVRKIPCVSAGSAFVGESSQDRRHANRPPACSQSVPIVSSFSGVVIRMYYRGHELPHFHAEFRGEQGKYSFDGELIAGGIRSASAERRIRCWAALHDGELLTNWKRMNRGEPLKSIAPLE